MKLPVFAPRVRNLIHRNRNLFSGVFFVSAMLGGSVHAHQTYLLPDKFHHTEAETVSVALTSALAFPNMESGPAKDRIASFSVSIGDEIIEDVSFEEGGAALTMRFAAERLGTAVVAISSKPRAGEIPPEDVELYLDEIEADAVVREAFDALPGSPPLRRSYAKHAKTFFCIKTCDGANKLATPAGQKLEFVAGAGSFRLLLDGKPLAGKQVTIVPFDGETSSVATDEHGKILVPDALSGVIMLSAVWITLPDEPDGVYHSDYATLTVDLGRLP
ncbi:DUF4198 domain-containing protein [Hyphococcus sp.]|jgi:hypothetical protein|uniref:DUF4198 domain-containing protein n=1 Tax=Hyphococcus sp. TaxID=2038636 RepID=UPI003D0D7AEF